MNRLRLWIRNVFGFSRSEANGFLILLPLIMLVLFSYPLYKNYLNTRDTDLDIRDEELDSLLAQWEFNPEKEERANTPIKYYSFDPNLATTQQFEELGFPEYLFQRINNYRKAGGRFNKRNDLLKIYGMDSALYFQLEPYISIADSPSRPAESNKKETIKPRVILFDINVADTAQLKLIYGIGPVLAARIIKYRDALGGFISTQQLKEVYGLDSTTLINVQDRIFIQSNFMPSQLDINQATEKELSSHPYIRSKLAKNIVAYRFQHGSFAEIDDLLKLDLIDESKLRQITPYLKIVP